MNELKRKYRTLGGTKGLFSKAVKENAEINEEKKFEHLKHLWSVITHKNEDTSIICSVALFASMVVYSYLFVCFGYIFLQTAGQAMPWRVCRYTSWTWTCRLTRNRLALCPEFAQLLPLETELNIWRMFHQHI